MPNKKSDYHTYIHSDPSITTLGSFVSNPISIGIGLNIVDLLNYEDNTDRKDNKNIDNLEALYTSDELIAFKPLLDQIRASNLKQKIQQSTVIDSNIGNNSTPVEVINRSVVDPSVFITPSNKYPLSVLKKLTNDLNNKDYQGKQLLDVSGGGYRLDQNRINELLNEDVRNLFKYFILKVSKDTLYEVQINSVFRLTPEGLTTSDVLKDPKKDQNRHAAKLAIDINLIHKTDATKNITSGGFNKKKISKKLTDPGNTQALIDWNSSGVPEVASKLHLKWGATFSDQFDPVHFDARNYFDIQPGYYQALVDSLSPSTQQTTEEVSETTTVATEQGAVNQNQIFADLPLHLGTVLNLELVKIDREVIITETNQVFDSINFNFFIAGSLRRLLSDPNYKRIFPTGDKKRTINSVKEIFPHISVWIWSRAASMIEEGVFNHQIYNITPYIGSLTTNVGLNGGSFSIDVAPIAAELIDNYWKPIAGNQKTGEEFTNDYVSQNFSHYEEDSELKRNRFFFEKNFQQNDIVFIRFERLVIEENRFNLDELQTISISDLPNQIFDMIGLIDTISIATSPATASVSINISGRDLVKLIIEDGVYFYPSDFIGGGIFANETGAGNKRLNRYNGNILTRFQFSNKTIDRSLKFIINALSSIDICPTDLFDGYRAVADFNNPGKTIDERSVAYQLTEETKEQIANQQRIVDDTQLSIVDRIERVRQNYGINEDSATIVYNDIERFLKQNIQDRTIVDNSVDNTILSWQELIGHDLVKDQQPKELEDKFFMRERVWVTDNFLPITQDTALIKNIEDLFRGEENFLKDHSQLICANLLRVDKSLPKDPDKRTFFTLDDLISELINIFNNAILEEGVSFNTKAAGTLINSKSLSGVPFQTALATIISDYDVIKKQGRKINLLIIEKKIADFVGDEKPIFDDIYKNIKIKENLESKKNISLQLLPVNGIWQIIKLIIDPSIKNRLLADASIGNEMGSLINGIRKICQEPFVEFFTDTYRNQFFFVVRKPPFDQQSIVSFLDNTVTAVIENSVSENGAEGEEIADVEFIVGKNITIDIEEADVLSDSLSYSREAYSWYRLQLKNLISGNDADLSFAYLKAVYFNEYADMFGSKPLDISTNYIPVSAIADKNNSLSSNSFIEQGINDLKYLIETHAYLPFTRQGTIVIDGDRRIKRGTFIRLKSTSEIFYVDAVSHSFSVGGDSIDRVTTLQVSRGMVETYIKGKEFNINGEKINVSYFNICDLPIDSNAIRNKNLGYSEFNKLTIARWKVIPEVFSFFVQKLQFAKNNKELIAPYLS